MPGKGEIDKEKLFKKIMPSFSLPEGEDPAGVLPLEVDISIAPGADGTAFPAQTQAAPTPVDAALAQPGGALAHFGGAQMPVEDAAQAQAEAAPAEAASAEAAPAEEEEPVYPVNLPELIIERYYNAYSKRFHCCDCSVCRDDARSLALNKVQPRYVPSDRITEDMLTDREMITETVTTLINALIMVKNNPRH